MVSNQSQDTHQNTKMSGKIIVTVLIGFWAILGITGFIMSIICFGRSGSSLKHIIGLLLAIFFGPIYWIFYFFVPDYCKRILS